MHCEYCDIVLEDPAEARRHILTVAHFRKKTSYDLSINMYAQRKQIAESHPKDFKELCGLLNMRSNRDVRALWENRFFKITNDWHCKVAEELMHAICRAENDYYLRRLPGDLRKNLTEMLEERDKERNKDQDKES